LGRLGLIWLLVCTVLGGLLLAKGAQPTRAAGLGVAVAARHGDPPRRFKNIEDVQAGERVWAYDVRSGAWSVKPVLRPLVHQYDGELVTLTVLGRKIEATINHPFWVTSGAELSRRPAAADVPVAERASLAGTGGEAGRWVDAGHLRVGDVLVVSGGAFAAVEDLKYRRVRQPVYNLEVADLHTYAVSDAGVVVHNKAMQIAPINAAESTAGKSLLPGEGAVGTYDELIAAGSKGDNITPHHIPSANYMEQYGVSKGDGISINMEQPFPGAGGRHRLTFTYGTQADIGLTPRQALGQGIWDTRQIYQQDGLYGPQIRSALQDVIQQNRAANPGLFYK
jgi:hypothetical protein